jgi:hypothetical protein
LGQARDGIFLGYDGFAAQDFDLGFEGRGKRYAAAGSFDVVECLLRIPVFKKRNGSKSVKNKEQQPFSG